MKYRSNSVWSCNLCPSLHEDFCMYIAKNMDLNWSISISNNISTVPYFNLHNNIDPGEATKVAKIRMDAPKYLDYYNDSLIKDWVLTNNEIDKLIDILTSHDSILDSHKLEKTVFYYMVDNYYDQLLYYWPEHKQPIIYMPMYHNLYSLENDVVNDKHLDYIWNFEAAKLGEHHSSCLACKYMIYEYLDISIFVTKNNMSIPYFIMYNSVDPSDATKVARIRLDKPEYLKYQLSYTSRISEWHLNDEEINTLMILLNETHSFPEECTTYGSLYKQFLKLQYGDANMHFYKLVVPDYTLLKEK